MDGKYEIHLNKQGFSCIAGIDEVGRGALAGPIVAAAVILKPDCLCNLKFYQKINDSKKISPKLRVVLADTIRANCVCWAIGEVDNQEIDKINIGNANRLCFKKAVQSLAVPPNYILSDYVPLLSFGKIPFENIKKGDGLYLSIACASILAKVYRDGLMLKLAEIHQNYGFELHKGYGTKDHLQKIKELGLCPIHRRSFSLTQTSFLF